MAKKTITPFQRYKQYLQQPRRSRNKDKRELLKSLGLTMKYKKLGLDTGND